MKFFYLKQIGALFGNLISVTAWDNPLFSEYLNFIFGEIIVDLTSRPVPLIVLCNEWSLRSKSLSSRFSLQIPLKSHFDNHLIAFQRVVGPLPGDRPRPRA